MTPEDIRTVEEKAWEIRNPVEIRFGMSEDGRTSELEVFLNALTRRVEKIRYRREDLPEGAPPSIKLPRGVEFLSVPTGVELPPFMELIEVLSGHDAAGPDPLAEPHRERIDAITAVCPLRLHIARKCPHCPAAVSRWSRIAAAGAHIRLSVIETDLFPELTKSDNVRAVPALVFDASLRWTGNPRPDEVLPVLADQDPARLGDTALESMIRDGEAAGLARMMIRREQIFPAIFDLLTHPKWPTRLGAMVVMETLAEEDPELAASAVDPLMKRFAGLENAAKGDVLYVMGETGTGTAIRFIETAASETDDEELKAAAGEAILRIRERAATPKEKIP